MDAATGQLPLESLEALASALRTNIISDINAWEDRQLAESQAALANRGQKRSQGKRQRAQQLLPDPPATTLLGLRQIQLVLCQAPDAAGTVSIWAIGILALFVSLADMKGDFRLSDLQSLPATKVAFHMLEFAVGSDIARMSVEAAETVLIDRVLATSKDSRAAGWILSQYGVVHGDTFPKCLQMYTIARMAQPMAAAGLEAASLAQTVADLSLAQPTSAKKALEDILVLYRDTVSMLSGDVDKLRDIPADDSRRFILFYVLQASRHSRGLLVLLDDSLASGGHGDWLTSAIGFEMRTGFSQFHVCTEGSETVVRPLAAAIETLYMDTMAGRPKKASDQPLDFGRVLSAFTFIGAVVRGSSFAGQGSHKAASEPDDDVEMADDTKDDEPLALFVSSCHDCLVRLIAREQELVILNQMPRSVKNMPQPIPNGLHEAVQKGARMYNNGPISMPAVGQEEANAVWTGLFDVLATSGGRCRSAASRLLEMACDTAPMLIEILVSRMVDTPDHVKRLVSDLVEFWPLHNIYGVVEMHNVHALYRALLAISEANRGLLLRQVLDVIESALARQRHDLPPSLLQQMVDLLAAAISHHHMLAESPMQVTSLLAVREVIGDLRGVLVVCWPQLWSHCFAGDGSATRLQVTLVKTVTLAVPLRTTDCLTLAEYAVKELVRTQAVIACRTESAQLSDGCLLELAGALLALVSALASHPGVGRVAMEKLLRSTLLPTLTFTQPGASRLNKEQLDAVFEVGGDDDENVDSPRKRLKLGLHSGSIGDSGLGLDLLLDGSLLPRTGDRKVTVVDQEGMLAKAETMLWQNAVRPMLRYPRSGMHSHDRTKDAWAFMRPTTKPCDGDGSTRPFLVFGLMSLAYAAPSGMTTLCELLEEFYIDCLPSMPPHLLDERLGGSGVRLQLRSVEMELVQDIRENSDLEHVLFNVIGSGPAGASAAKRLVSALLVALVVFWNGALGEPTVKRERDLRFTSRLVAHVIDAYGDGKPSPRLCDLFPMISGGDLARLLHQYVWRWIVHQMPSAEDESQRLLQHIMRRYVVNAAPLFKYLVAIN
ncbi:hypothetical protein GGI20_000654 [Coemansia sp. BCRC 34301]|nr:hypothetical protein GGI20_000654 [Coemansia sp. BCRC 34301]